MDDAEAIVDISDFQDASFVMDVIEGLLDRSLLIILREGPRFSMLRSIFDFAAQKLNHPAVKRRCFSGMSNVWSMVDTFSRVLSTRWG